MPEAPLPDDTLAENAGADLIRLMWCGGLGAMTWTKAREQFARMWGMGRKADEEEVDRLLRAGAVALGHRGVPKGNRDRDPQAVQPRELADHWSRSIRAALAAGRFEAAELSAFFERFRAPVDLGDELMRIYFEAEGLSDRKWELLDQVSLLWAEVQEAGRGSDLAWARGREERTRDRDEAIADGTQRRLAASRAFSGARSEAKGAAQRVVVAERRLAGGRATAEEVEQARELLRRAEEVQDEAKAALDRVDEEIKDQRRQRREATTPGDVRRHNRTTAERFQAEAHAEVAVLERRLREIEQWHQELYRSVAQQDAFHLEQAQEAYRQRVADLARAAEQRVFERDQELAEKRHRERAAALGDPNRPVPTGPATPPEPPGVEETIRSLRERYGSHGSGESASEDDPDGSPSAPRIGFTFPSEEPARSDGPERQKDVSPAGGESPWSPPPIGFAFPAPDTEGTNAS